MVTRWAWIQLYASPGQIQACCSAWGWADLQHASTGSMNLSLFNYNINVLICFPKLYLILLQVCGARSVFSECWFPHLCDHSAGPLSLQLSDHCSHASFWAKYIFRAILSSKSYALLSLCTQKPLLTSFSTTFIELELCFLLVLGKIAIYLCR